MEIIRNVAVCAAAACALICGQVMKASMKTIIICKIRPYFFLFIFCLRSLLCTLMYDIHNMFQNIFKLCFIPARLYERPALCGPAGLSCGVRIYAVRCPPYPRSSSMLATRRRNMSGRFTCGFHPRAESRPLSSATVISGLYP